MKVIWTTIVAAMFSLVSAPARTEQPDSRRMATSVLSTIGRAIGGARQEQLPVVVQRQTEPKVAATQPSAEARQKQRRRMQRFLEDQEQAAPVGQYQFAIYQADKRQAQIDAARREMERRSMQYRTDVD